ncbi:copper resistance protein NlpE N-terminal domain-containing protein [Puia dinghuensis]|uniref:Copper resistance protein NlpE n=1 Tax=Puia dinghuensis TaxID=1792502 RepID=A0A8J2UDN0_9BACT|nr:copper resistance protein NlpE N-terminal domain-containing protein [Puia dinghuensis]GGB01999.1 hypothetical protein GCM10011511_26550 [Puia dinghuensis]
MKQHSIVGILFLLILTGCNSNSNINKVKDPEAVVSQAVTNDTLVTVYDGVRPCKGCKEIATEIIFERRLQDTVGRFHLSEAYINKKDSAFQHYQGVGNYKIIPAANGDVKGIAVYNMVLDDQSRGYLYLLADSLTMVRIDEKGQPVQGDEAITLKKSAKKI